MRKTMNVLFVIVFIGLCFAPFLGQIFGYRNVNSEKRELAALPSFMTKDGINPKYTNELDDYFTENFAFRTDLITLQAFLYQGVFQQSVSDRVIIGQDGWLFFEPTVNDYTKDNVLSDNEIYRMYRTLSIQQTYLEGLDIDCVFMVAPNKSSIYGKYMPDRYLQVEDKNNGEKLYSVCDENGFVYLDLFTLLRGNDTQLYHKLDTHWNNYGAMMVYNALLTNLQGRIPGFVYDTHQDLVPTIEQTWSGDLSGMLYPTANLLDTQYVYPIAKEYVSDRPIRSMEDLTIHTTCETGSGHILMFRDSFANALIPLLSNEFADVTYARATPYDFSQIDNDTDAVILEIAERNLPNLIKEAPRLPSYQVQLDASLTPVDIASSLIVEEESNSIRINGFAIPSGYRKDTNYDIYIRLQSGDKEYTFVTFPIMEDGYFPDDTDKANAAFSLMIQKDSLPAGQYSIQTIMYDQAGYMISQNENADVITIQ